MLTLLLLFIASRTDELLTAPDALDAEEKVNQTDKGAHAAAHRAQYTHAHNPLRVISSAALVEEMLGALREEVKEMDRTNWLYETQDPQVAMRVTV